MRTCADIAQAAWTGCRSVFADVAEVHSERAKLTIQVGALHPDPLGELADLAVAQQELLLQVSSLELLARFATLETSPGSRSQPETSVRNMILYAPSARATAPAASSALTL